MKRQFLNKCSLTFILALSLIACDSNDAPAQDTESKPDTETDIDQENDDLSYLPKLENDLTWTLQPQVSNEFNFDGGKEASEFTTDWKDGYINSWTGPGITQYSYEQSDIVDGELVYHATIEGEKIKTGCISSKAAVTYPMYMEVRVKLSESVLSSAVWMLSDDSTEEIDNLEAFGAKSSDYFSKRLHLSHHVFIRDPFQDYQPEGPETWYADGKNTIWSDDYHNYGVLWEDPWSLSYYVDGKMVRKTPVDEIDPKNFTNGNGLTKPMHMIISAAAQSWRSSDSQGAGAVDFLTDPTVANVDKTIMKVDWIRVYKPE
ncbi:family 16 glycosylhydrolase [Pseudotamlana carrageenivorans]|uniref:Beta-agarase n=1 Tax=Pseudotamlana carrageenivorans TaxID=2069432 RepID=A0A2I7SJX8_9FLAO|nr:family 16 glycosylhydrolase [Tamlana carrageenivorans]AUS06215.1 beta-agarase [Tamlana carrageenivorans]